MRATYNPESCLMNTVDNYPLFLNTKKGKVWVIAEKWLFNNAANLLSAKSSKITRRNKPFEADGSCYTKRPR